MALTVGYPCGIVTQLVLDGGATKLSCKSNNLALLSACPALTLISDSTDLMLSITSNNKGYLTSLVVGLFLV